MKTSALGGRLTVGLQTLDLRIGVRIPASQPILSIGCVLREDRLSAKLLPDCDLGHPRSRTEPHPRPIRPQYPMESDRLVAVLRWRRRVPASESGPLRSRGGHARATRSSRMLDKPRGRNQSPLKSIVICSRNAADPDTSPVRIETTLKSSEWEALWLKFLAMR